MLSGSIIMMLAAATSPAPYKASGNEPFWALGLTGSTLTLSQPGMRDRAYRVKSRRTAGGEQIVRAGPLRVSIERRLCIDTMSGLPRPDTVRLILAGTPVRGCGGDPRITIADEEWTVHRIDGEPLKGSRPATIRFKLDSRASGSTGCNRWFASYELTGEGLRFLRPESTRMACQGASGDDEARFLKVLQGVTRFVPTDDGTLTLEGTTGTIVARREQ